MKNKNDHIPAMCQEPERAQRAEINSLPSRRKQMYKPTTLSMTGNGGRSSEVCFQHVNLNIGLDHSDSWETEATNMQMSHMWMNRQHTPSRAVGTSPREDMVWVPTTAPQFPHIRHS